MKQFKTRGPNAKTWLRDTGYKEAAKTIGDLERQWLAEGKRTRRNWWDILAGAGERDREQLGLPLLRAAAIRQGRELLPLAEGPDCDPRNFPAPDDRCLVPRILPRAVEFLAPLREHLHRVPHFGVIAPTLGSSTTRLQHVEQISFNLFDLCKRAPGLGLGSSRNFPKVGNQKPWAGLGEWSGTEICQAWAFLLNAGHLFGTFATERGLAFALDTSLNAHAELVAGARKCGTSEIAKILVAELETRLDRSRLHDLHYCLAVWRVASSAELNLTDSQRQIALKLLAAFLRPPSPKIERLVDIYRGVRRVTYLRLHATLKSAHVRIDAIENIASMFPEDASQSATADSAPIWRLLDAVDAYEAREFFGSTDVASVVLAHTASFKQWWRANKDRGLSYCLDRLWVEPRDWPSESPSQLRHCSRLQFPAGAGWLHEVRLWLRDESGHDPWSEGNFLVTPTPQGLLQIDVYGSERGLSIAGIRQVSRQLSRAIAGATPSARAREIWLTTARFIAALFEAMLKDGYRIRITPIPARGEHLGCATTGSTYALARANLKRFLAVATDDQRATELRQLLAVTDTYRTWHLPTMIMFARAEVIRPNGTALTDIDGLLARFQGDSLFWTIVETKKAKSQNGANQLKRGILKALRGGTASSVENRNLNGQAIWHFEYEVSDIVPIRSAIPQTS
ncbi:MAG: hypothetical protein RKU31_01890 [Deltaproteobacteria bacterium]